MVNVLKFYFCSQIQYWFVRIANREDPDQTASEKQPDLCLSDKAVCLRLFGRQLVLEILEYLL